MKETNEDIEPRLERLEARCATLERRARLSMWATAVLGTAVLVALGGYVFPRPSPGGPLRVGDDRAAVAIDESGIAIERNGATIARFGANPDGDPELDMAVPGEDQAVRLTTSSITVSRATGYIDLSVDDVGNGSVAIADGRKIRAQLAMHDNGPALDLYGSANLDYLELRTDRVKLNTEATRIELDGGSAPSLLIMHREAGTMARMRPAEVVLHGDEESKHDIAQLSTEEGLRFIGLK